MNDAQNKTCKHNIFTQKLALIIMLMTASTMSAAELKWKDSDQDSESEVAYVDSVTKWGAWELDIEPAAGGLTPPSTGALNARNSRVAVTYKQHFSTGTTDRIKTTCYHPVAPIMPPVIPAAPPAPPVPVTPPIGGPTDGLF